MNVVTVWLKAIGYGLLCLLFCCLSACKTTEPSLGSPEAKKINASKINMRLGMAYLERNDIVRAKQKFIIALEEAPQLPEAWYSMAFFMEKTNNNDKANTYYQKAIALAPDRGDTLNNYGTFLCRTGRMQEAINYFLRATRDFKYLDPSAAYENAGLCAMKIPNKKLALKYFEKAVGEDPSRPTSLLALAELNYQTHNYVAAAKNLKKYLIVAPPDADTSSLEKRLLDEIPA